MLWQFFSLPGIENGIEYRYFSRYRIEVRNSSIVTTLIQTTHYSEKNTDQRCHCLKLWQKSLTTSTGSYEALQMSQSSFATQKSCMWMFCNILKIYWCFKVAWCEKYSLVLFHLNQSLYCCDLSQIVLDQFMALNSDVTQPCMVTHTRNLCSAFNPSKARTRTQTRTRTRTHTEQLGVRCLAQGQLSRGIEGGESAGHSPPHRQSLPDRDSNSQPLYYTTD